MLNTRRKAREHISSHYDAGNEMFELFLDRENMMYSSAYFEHEGQSLEDAQLVRLERICEMLELGPGDHLLEIGTGWGGLAVHAAATRGCRVTTTTISDEQRGYAIRRIREAGLAERVRVPPNQSALRRDLTFDGLPVRSEEELVTPDFHAREIRVDVAGEAAGHLIVVRRFISTEDYVTGLGIHETGSVPRMRRLTKRRVS